MTSLTTMDNRASQDRRFYEDLKRFIDRKNSVGPTWDDWKSYYGSITDEFTNELDALYDRILKSTMTDHIQSLEAYNNKIIEIVNEADFISEGKLDNMKLDSNRGETESFMKFSEILNTIQKKTTNESNNVNQEELKNQFKVHLKLFLDYGILDDQFLNQRADKPSKCTSWFNSFDPEDQADILRHSG